MLPDRAGAGPRTATSIRWRIVGLLMLLSFTNYFNRISMTVAGDRIMAEYPIDEVRMGWVYSALLIAYTAFMVPGGWLGDRIGGRATLTLVGLGTALFCALSGLAGHPALAAAGLTWPALLVVRALMGAFTAPLYPAAGRVVVHWIPFRGRALANGLVTGAAMVGIALAHPLFEGLVAGTGWRWAFVLSGMGTGLLAVLWAWYSRDEPSGHRSVDPGELALIGRGGPGGPAGEPIAGGTAPPDSGPARSRSGGSWGDLANNRSLWLLAACYATIGYAEYLIFYWSGYYFEQVLHFGDRESRLAAMLPPLAMAVGMPLGGWVADRLMGPLGYRWGRASVSMGGMVACGLLLCAGTLSPSPPVIVACFAMALGAIGMCEGAAWTTAIDLGGTRGATSAAIVNTGGNVGGFLSPVVTPWVGVLLTPSLGRELGWAWGLRIGGLACLAGACLWLWIDAGDRGRRRADDDPPLG
jgi:ACS family glucarate transporter-like MFS transporter